MRKSEGPTITEADYQSLTEFVELPLYNDDDPRCGSIDMLPHEPEYMAVFEADNITLANEYRCRDDLVPKGAIRHWNGQHTQSTIMVYFWQKR